MSTENAPTIFEYEGKEYFNMGDSADYLGVSYAALQKILVDPKNAHIRKWKLGFGKSRYLLKSDLDDLKRMRQVED